jgi:phosphonate transport system substrate-binding protein
MSICTILKNHQKNPDSCTAEALKSCLSQCELLMIKLPILFLLLFIAHIPLAQCETLAVSKSESKTLVIGIFPRRDAALTMRLFKPLKNYLQQHTQFKFTLEASANFDTFRKNMQLRRYDLVHFNQYHYVKAHDRLNYDILVQNEEFGEENIRGGIYVRKDSGLESLQQLRGKSILFGGGKEAMMSYIVPRYLLAKAGLQPSDFTSLFATNPPNSILATYTRQVVACGAGEIATRLPVVTKKIDTSELKALAISDSMAHLPWAIKHELDDDIKQQIKDLLLGLKHSEAGRKVLQAAKLSAFNPATDEDYNPHREIINFVETTSKSVHQVEKLK